MSQKITAAQELERLPRFTVDGVECVALDSARPLMVKAMGHPRCLRCGDDFDTQAEIDAHTQVCPKHPIAVPLAKIRTAKEMIKIYRDGDEPEGQLSTAMLIANLEEILK